MRDVRTTSPAFPVVQLRHLVRLPLAVVRVGLAVASAHRQKNPETDLRSLDAGATRVRNAALPGIELTPKSLNALNARNSSAELPEAGGQCAVGAGERKETQCGNDQKLAIHLKNLPLC